MSVSYIYVTCMFIFEIFIFEVLIILIKFKKKLINFAKSCRSLSKARTEICALDLVIKVLGTLIKISVK